MRKLLFAEKILDAISVFLLIMFVSIKLLDVDNDIINYSITSTLVVFCVLSMIALIVIVVNQLISEHSAGVKNVYFNLVKEVLKYFAIAFVLYKFTELKITIGFCIVMSIIIPFSRKRNKMTSP